MYSKNTYTYAFLKFSLEALRNFSQKLALKKIILGFDTLQKEMLIQQTLQLEWRLDMVKVEVTVATRD